MTLHVSPVYPGSQLHEKVLGGTLVQFPLAQGELLQGSGMNVILQSGPVNPGLHTQVPLEQLPFEPQSTPAHGSTIQK